MKMPTPRECYVTSLKLIKSNLLVIFTITAVFSGLMLGIILQQFHIDNQGLMIIGFPGEILLRLLKLLIVPLIITSIITGITSLEIKSSSKIALRGLTYYFSTTLFAILLGLILVVTIKPGLRNEAPAFLEESPLGAETRSTVDAALDMIRNLFPDNFVKACFTNTKTVYSYRLTNGTNGTVTNTTMRELSDTSGINMSGLVCIAFIIGIALLTMKEEGESLIALIKVSNTLVMKLVICVLWYSPIGILSLIAKNVAETDDIGQMLEQLGWLILTVLLGLSIHGFITLPLLYVIISMRNPFKLFYNLLPALLVAFGTSSSSGAMPVTMRCLEGRVKIDKRITQFLIPIGTTINMDGTALYEAIAAIFIAQLYRLDLTFIQYILVVLTATIASVGAAAIPSSGLITIMIVLNILGIPYNSVFIIFSIDWFLDRFRTTVNVWGDSIGAGIVESLSASDLDLSNEKEGISKFCTTSFCRFGYQRQSMESQPIIKYTAAPDTDEEGKEKEIEV
ncbi:excitatory amino acid transporter 4 isoform 2 [Oopsacas minuta]|uniref:Amino acid transporter n=1 Tax=Oopsacas minuta TaxID=111878 RepID=A0AAV7JX07_9METZ|nr:excitatory amino acid transporter 4 isoform 2 [Oopsacas minuta]